MDFISGWCKSKRRLQGILAIVTGGNAGIGRETVLDLYLRGECKETEFTEQILEFFWSKVPQVSSTRCRCYKKMGLSLYRIFIVPYLDTFYRVNQTYEIKLPPLYVYGRNLKKKNFCLFVNIIAIRLLTYYYIPSYIQF